MPDKTGPAVLRGFNVAVADVGDRLCFCQPVLSFRGDSTLYVARKLDWRDDQKALAVTDPDDVNERGTPLPDARQSIASGEGVVAVGTGFVQAAVDAGIQLDHAEMSFSTIDDAKCWIGVATPERFEDLEKRLTEEARTVFDEALGEAARHGRPLSERGNAALLLLRRCGPRRRDDLAIRQLAGALQNRELDLYRRLRIRFSDELDTQEDDLDRKAELHITLSARPWWRLASYLPPEQKPATLWELPSRDMPFLVSSILERKTSASDDKFSAVMKLGKSWREAYLESRNSRKYVYDIAESISHKALESMLKKITLLLACPSQTIEISSGEQRETSFSMNSMTLPISGKGIMDTRIMDTQGIMDTPRGWEVS